MMTRVRFEKLIRERRFGQRKTGRESGRTLRALHYYLVKGDSVLQACHKAGELSPSALYQALSSLRYLPRQRKKLKREKCPHCGQLLPNNKLAPRGTPKTAPQAYASAE